MKLALKFFFYFYSITWKNLFYKSFKKFVSLEFGVSSVEPVLFSSWHDGIFYFSGEKDGTKVFLKYDSWFGFYTNEVLAYQMLNKNPFKRYILPLLAYGDGVLIYPYFEEDTLQKFLNENPRISQEDCFKIHQQLLEILSMLKTNNILHRDLTLKNIFISKELELKVFDFYYATSPVGDFKNFRSWLGVNFVLRRLGYQISPFEWNDAYSLTKSIQNLQSTSTFYLFQKDNFLR